MLWSIAPEMPMSLYGHTFDKTLSAAVSYGRTAFKFGPAPREHQSSGKQSLRPHRGLRPLLHPLQRIVPCIIVPRIFTTILMFRCTHEDFFFVFMAVAMRAALTGFSPRSKINKGCYRRQKG